MNAGRYLLCFVSFFLLVSCSVQKRIGRSAREVITTPALQTAHVGISIYEPATGKYWYNYQGDHYFVPASNTKIPTCYAAMKYLGDSLVGMRIGIPEEQWYSDNAVIINVTGDPTFLHSEFVKQPVFDFLKNSFRTKKTLGFLVKNDTVERWGNGWSWNDYESGYMAERSPLPVFGNVIDVHLLDTSKRKTETLDAPGIPQYKLFSTGVHLFDSLVNQPLFYNSIPGYFAEESNPKISLGRTISDNHFLIRKKSSGFTEQVIPFVTNGAATATSLLLDTLHAKFALVQKNRNNEYSWETEDGYPGTVHIQSWDIIHSQPTDSLLKPMMHRSDNFFAEQSLLMVSNERLGYMKEGAIIDTLLKTDFKDLPQKPRWVDGSGLSRYNLFSPQDFVSILNKMKNEFGMDRIKEILPTGGEGTLGSYYRKEKDLIFGKTGTLSGVVAFSGFLYTRKGKLLIFSTLVNNHNQSATDVRRAIEKFLEGIRENY